MPQTSSHGAGAPKQRTINVEVNLLAEWIESRTRLREDRNRWTVILTTVALVSIAVLPILSDVAAHQQSRARMAERTAAGQEQALGMLKERLGKVQPQLDNATTLAISQRRSSQFLGEVLSVLNSANPRMALESIEASILGGDVSLRAKAQAETYAAAQEFVASAGKGSHVKSAILASARQNNALGADGVSFEFAKKVAVNP